MRELTNLCLKGGEKEFIFVTKFGGTRNDKNKSNTKFDKAINFLLGNLFFLILVIFHFDKSLKY